MTMMMMMMMTNDETQAVHRELKSHQNELEELTKKCLTICPILSRNFYSKNTAPPCAAIAVCAYKHSEVHRLLSLVVVVTALRRL